MNRQDYPFTFTGNGGEYFRIWIVNVLLTIVTFGIYSAWATVRNKRYFYSNTILDGSSFEYTAEPMTILRGRIVAVVVLVLFQAASFISPIAGLLATGLLALVVPALIVMSLRFRMRYTSWRNIQFGFLPNFKFAYLLFGIPALILAGFIGLSFVMQTILPTEDAPISEPSSFSQTLAPENGLPEDSPATDDAALNFDELGMWSIIFLGAFVILILLAWLLFPLWQRLYYKFVANHTQYGTTGFQFIATTPEFYAIYMKAGLITAVALALFAAIAALFTFLEMPGISSVLAIPMIAIFMYARAYITTQLTNTIYGNLELQEIGFRSELGTNRMAWIYFSNAVAVLLSLGLLIPWAQVRMAKYRASTMTLRAENFDDFQARIGADVSAQGAEVSDFMDIDIGL